MHVNSNECPGCKAKLSTAHPDLIAFANSFRATNPDAHISCSNRNEADQEAAYATGHSHAKWGQSAHDYIPALALDWFRLTQAAGANFDAQWFQSRLAPAARACGLVWGGDWKSIKDMPHVELANWKSRNLP